MAKHTGIRKLPNGRFRARYFAGYDSKGKRRYPAKTFDTQRAALDWRAEQVSARGPGSVDGCSTTLAAFLDQWLASKHNIRDNTRETYSETIEQYIKPGLGNIKLNRLSAQQIENWQTELLKRLGPTTVSHARTVLYGACKKAVRMNLIRANPVAGTDGPGRSNKKTYPLTVEEALRFVPACEGMRFGLMCELMLQTGLRPEEAIGLCWQDLDLHGHRGTVNVRRSVLHLKGIGWKWSEPKTKSSVRRIVFPSELAAKLLEHRKVQLEQKFKLGQAWKNNDLVFPTSAGEPLRQCALYKYFKAILKKAGLPSSVTVYSLRHAFVTFSLVAGVDAKTVSNEAGHANVAFTLTRYGHVLDEMHETSCDKREGLLKGRRK
jgi:integrase